MKGKVVSGLSESQNSLSLSPWAAPSSALQALSLQSLLMSTS